MSSESGSSRSPSSSISSSTTTNNTTQNNTTQTFPLAHPPPKTPNCFRLSPRLLLQIQQLAPSSRPIPVLELYQPPRLGKSVANGHPKLNARDMYLVQSEGYTHLAETVESASGQRSPGSDVAAAIYCDPRRGAHEIYIPGNGMVWSVGEGGYRFTLRGADGSAGGKVVEWETRPRSRAGSGSGSAGSAGSGSAEEERGDRFVLSIVDSGLRRTGLATLTRKGFKVGRWERAQRGYVLGEGEAGCEDDSALYTCVLAFGAYLAAREGWLNL